MFEQPRIIGFPDKFTRENLEVLHRGARRGRLRMRPNVGDEDEASLTKVDEESR